MCNYQILLFFYKHVAFCVGAHTHACGHSFHITVQYYYSIYKEQIIID